MELKPQKLLDVGEPWDGHVICEYLFRFNALIMFEIQSMILVYLKLHYA